MNFFDLNANKQREQHAPFAEKLRPKRFEDVLGQDELLKQDGIIMSAIRTGNPPSMILFGPPGTGKTTMAELISKSCNMNFYKVSAVAAGVKDLREVVDKARENLAHNMGRTILFIDEIHRFSKSQQDFLLPYVESGELVLIGATTENPFFAVNKALLSRLLLINVKPLDDDALSKLLDKCIDIYSDYNNTEVILEEEARAFLIKRAGGDARRLINSFEVSVLNSSRDGKATVTVGTVRDNFMNSSLKYDSTDEHYDTISAFIKSMRGSDVDATVFYLAKMLLSGEDPLFIARRMVIFASEDVGNADPRALSVAASAFYAATVIGMPEVRINLSQAAIYLASAPKSNSSYLAIDKAVSFIKENGAFNVPSHLQDTHYQGAAELGRGGYIYPHNFDNDYVKQQYLPDGIVNEKFYFSKGNGYEEKMNEFLKRIKGRE